MKLNCIPLIVSHHLFSSLQTRRLYVGFGTTGLAQSQGLPSGFQQLILSPVQTEGAGTQGRMVQYARGGVEGFCCWRQPSWSVVVMGEAKYIQGPHGCTVAAVRRGHWRRESHWVVVVEWKVGRDERVRQSGARRDVAHQKRP